MTERSARLEDLQKAYLDAFVAASSLPIGFFVAQEGSANGLLSKASVACFEPHCQYLHSLPGGRAACEEDHCGRAMSEIQRGAAGLTHCHAGMYNESIPVVVGGQVRGVLLYGQMQLDEEASRAVSLERHQQAVQKLGLSPAQAAELKRRLLAAKRYTPQDLATLKTRLPPIQTWFQTLMGYEDRLVWGIEKVAHEIQTRLQAVLAHAENLAHEVESLTPEQIKRQAQEVLYTSKALATVVRGMGEEYLQDYYFQVQPLAPLVYEARRLYEAEATARGIRIYVKLNDVNGHPPQLELSAHHMQYALNNLVHNAVKYSFRSGPGRDRFVDILGYSAKGGYELAIQNFGVGILPKEIADEAIFRDSYQGELTAGEYRTGSGKGLSIVKRVVTRHGGRIEVSSVKKATEVTHEGQPHLTQFRVWLPFTQPRRKGDHA
jgi:signal transduction histidine kinase